MDAALAVGSVVLGQVQNVGQLFEIGQNCAYQREQMHWTRRGYHLDSQSLRLDVLDHAKEEVRSHYETYVGRIDTWLLVLALVWPFALNTIQFSDPFVPMAEGQCPDCIEVEYSILVGIWVMLIAVVLLLPFWGILMLIRCKLKLDAWLEYSLATLHDRRRSIIIATVPSTPHEKAFPKTLSSVSNGSAAEEDEHRQDADTSAIVSEVVDTVLDLQERLQIMWENECGWLVHASMMMLLGSAFAALLLTSVSVWIFLFNKDGPHRYFSWWFGAAILGGGLLAPLAYLGVLRLRPVVEPIPRESTELVMPTVSSGILAATARNRRSSSPSQGSETKVGSPMDVSPSPQARGRAEGLPQRGPSQYSSRISNASLRGQ